MRNGANAMTMLASAACATAISLILNYVPGPVGLGGVGLLLCCVIFSIWPWAVVPVGILGSTIAAVLAGQTDLRSFLLAHVLVLAAGCAGLVIRRLFGLDRDDPVPRSYRLGAILLLATTAIGAIYGLAVGNATKDVMIATYQIAIIPAYFLITLLTLNSPRRRRNAAILYVVPITALTGYAMVSGGGHGGLLPLLAVPSLIVLVGRSRSWRQAGLALVVAGLAADVVLAPYRGVWVAGGIAVIILLIRGGRVARTGLTAAGIAGATLFAVVLLGGGLAGRLSVAGEALGRSAGYRVPEASVGWNVFVSRPLFGAGLGQTTPQIYLPGFAVTDVGPVYHSFYIVILANLGLIGLIAVLWPIAMTARAALANGASEPLAFAALTCGFLVAALVESPSDGHWELGLLPALTLLTLPPAASAARQRVRSRTAVRAVPVGALR